MSNIIDSVQIKRSAKTLTQLDNENITLKYGEPLVLPTEGLLVIGDADETNTVSSDLLIKIPDLSLADKGLYYDGTTLYDAEGNEVVLSASASDQSSKVNNVNPQASGVGTLNGTLYVSGSMYAQDGSGSATYTSDDKIPTNEDITPKWVAGTTYGVGAIVYYDATNKFYSCKTAHTASSSILPTSTYWQRLDKIRTQRLTFSTTGNGDTDNYDGIAAKTISYNSVGAAASSHTHNYAASSSAGGAATNLNVNATTSGTYYILGASSTGSQAIYRAYNASGTANTAGVRFDAATGVLYGAAWNDFAEFRETTEEPGTVVCEVGDGTMRISEKRLSAAPAVVSDTFGMVIGDEKEGTMPVAVAGRVLVKADPKEKYKVGDCVCAGINGTASVMTRKEIQTYPDRILGTISEIPTYEEWNGVKVNNRIWIKVR